MKLSRELVLATPEVIYVAGTDMLNLSTGGLVGELSGLPNVYFIPVMYKHCLSMSLGAFFNDACFNGVVCLINNKIDEIKRQGKRVVVHEKIGQGCSKLHAYAPITYAYLKSRLKDLQDETNNKTST